MLTLHFLQDNAAAQPVYIIIHRNRCFGQTSELSGLYVPTKETYSGRVRYEQIKPFYDAAARFWIEFIDDDHQSDPKWQIKAASDKGTFKCKAWFYFNASLESWSNTSPDPTWKFLDIANVWDCQQGEKWTDVKPGIFFGAEALSRVSVQQNTLICMRYFNSVDAN
jgi:hypothetical protein